MINGRVSVDEFAPKTRAQFDKIEELDEYPFDVVQSDTNGEPIHIVYKRLDGTVIVDATRSNPDTNGFYQTIVKKTYDKDGTTLKQTKTYTLGYNSNGVVISKRWVIS